MNDLIQIIATNLSAKEIRFLLIGGMAVNQYNPSRQTFDLDFAIREVDAATARAQLSLAGFTVLHETNNFVRLNPPPGQNFATDLLLMDQHTFDLLWEARQTFYFADRPVATASPEHLIRMKLHAVQHGKVERQDKDIPDILLLMRHCGWAPDSEAFKAICLRHASPAVYGLIQGRWTARSR